jgi:hypothetical protein
VQLKPGAKPGFFLLQCDLFNLKHSLCAVIHYFQPDARRAAKNSAVLIGAKIAFDSTTVSTTGKLAGSDFLSFRVLLWRGAHST